MWNISRSLLCHLSGPLNFMTTVLFDAHILKEMEYVKFKQ